MKMMKRFLVVAVIVFGVVFLNQANAEVVLADPGIPSTEAHRNVEVEPTGDGVPEIKSHAEVQSIEDGVPRIGSSVVDVGLAGPGMPEIK